MRIPVIFFLLYTYIVLKTLKNINSIFYYFIYYSILITFNTKWIRTVDKKFLHIIKNESNVAEIKICFFVIDGNIKVNIFTIVCLKLKYSGQILKYQIIDS